MPINSATYIKWKIPQNWILVKFLKKLNQTTLLEKALRLHGFTTESIIHFFVEEIKVTQLFPKNRSIFNALYEAIIIYWCPNLRKTYHKRKLWVGTSSMAEWIPWQVFFPKSNNKKSQATISEPWNWPNSLLIELNREAVIHENH